MSSGEDSNDRELTEEEKKCLEKSSQESKKISFEKTKDNKYIIKKEVITRITKYRKKKNGQEGYEAVSGQEFKQEQTPEETTTSSSSQSTGLVPPSSSAPLEQQDNASQTRKVMTTTTTTEEGNASEPDLASPPSSGTSIIEDQGEENKATASKEEKSGTSSAGSQESASEATSDQTFVSLDSLPTSERTETSEQTSPNASYGSCQEDKKNGKKIIRKTVEVKTVKRIRHRKKNKECQPESAQEATVPDSRSTDIRSGVKEGIETSHSDSKSLSKKSNGTEHMFHRSIQPEIKSSEEQRATKETKIVEETGTEGSSGSGSASGSNHASRHVRKTVVEITEQSPSSTGSESGKQEDKKSSSFASTGQSSSKQTQKTVTEMSGEKREKKRSATGSSHHHHDREDSCGSRGINEYHRRSSPSVRGTFTPSTNPYDYQKKKHKEY